MKQAVWLAAALMMLLPLGKVYSKERSERENNTLCIMSYNIRNGRGMDDVTDFRRTAAVINKVCPDVVAVQEIDSVTGRSGGKDVLREIAGLTLMHHMYAPAIDYDGGKYGIGMLSKEKPLGYRYLPLPGREEARALLVVEFEKYIYFDVARGQALNELHLSYNMMNKSKWRTLAKAIEWQKNNYDILQNAMFIGGNPEENNIYGYFSWNDNGDGIIALRNPTDEKTSLTLTLNKLMGCPESLKDVKRYNVYNQSNKESFDSFSYGDKIDLALQPFEIKIFQFGSEDKRYPNREAVTDFTVSFNYKGEENIEIAHNDDIDISIVKGYVNIKCGRCHLRSNSIVSGGAHKITVVREKSKALKLYIDRKLDASGYDSRAKAKINTVIDSDAEDFNVIEKATPYDEIITLKNILAGVGKRKLFK